MKRILITGAAGFLGSHLCDRFIREGYHVIGMDNLITGDKKNIEHLFGLEQFEFLFHDVSKFVHVPGNLDYVLHFASPASPIDYLKIPIQTLKVGSLGTHNLLGLAKAKKCSHFSSLNKRSIWRPISTSAKRRLLGQCKSCWSARCLR
jgi:dTDP-glucose 4,6-dehydratase